MGDSIAISAPAEYFLWRRKGDTQHTNYTKVEPEQAGIGDALKLFNSKKKAVRRSTGGLVLAEPYQIVFDDGASRRGKPETRIKVRFLDFKFDSNKKITSTATVVHTKVVRPGDLRDAFTFDMAGKKHPSFVMDFGQGIVPVHIVGLGMSADGVPLVYFVDEQDFRRAGQGKGAKHLVQFHCAHRELLRLANPDRGKGSQSEYDFARENDANVRRIQGEVIPRVLAWGNSQLVPTQDGIHQGLRVLERVLEKIEETEEEAEHEKKSSREAEPLTPFGLFE